MQRIVLDTNCLIQSIPPKGKYHKVWLSLFDGSSMMCVSNEMIEEYHEILQRLTSTKVAKDVINAIIYNPYTIFITPYYKFNLIHSDPDDNKFVDCALSAGAKYIVTNDKHFDILKNIDFPKVDIITLIDFYNQLSPL